MEDCEHRSGKSIFISIDSSYPVCSECGSDVDVFFHKNKDKSIVFKTVCPICQKVDIFDIEHIHIQKTYCCDV